MREIIHIQVGQCGNAIGSDFLKLICQEQGISMTGSSTGKLDLQLDRINVYFKEITGPRYLPRAILIDLDPDTIASVRASTLGQLFRAENTVYGQYSAGNNWSKGFYSHGPEYIDQVLDIVRKEAEESESLQGFQLTHSLGGGTGSGLGTLLISKLKEEFPGKIIETFSVFPSPKVTDTVIEPYNEVLSLQYLLENADIVHVFDNEALYNICVKNLKISSLTYQDLNQVISVAMSNATCCLRFPDELNSSLQKLAYNLVPFPRLHFLMISYAPIVSNKQVKALTVPELTHELVNSKNLLAHCNPKYGKYLAALALFRGKITREEMHDQITYMQNHNKGNFAEWIPDNLKYSFCEIPREGAKMEATLVSNSTSIQEIFRREIEKFSKMFKRKLFLFGYNWDGLMDEMEFTEAESNLNDLISEYQQYQDATLDDEQEDEQKTS